MVWNGYELQSFIQNIISLQSKLLSVSKEGFFCLVFFKRLFWRYRMFSVSSYSEGPSFDSLHGKHRNWWASRCMSILSKGVPRQAEVALGIPGRLRPPDHLDVRHYKGGRSSAIRTGRRYPRKNPWYSFSEAESTSGHMVLSEGTTGKIPSDTTGNRSRDRPTSSAAP